VATGNSSHIKSAIEEVFATQHIESGK